MSEFASDPRDSDGCHHAHAEPGIPPDVVSERVNATEEIIEKHYDKRTQEDRMRLRRDKLDDLL